MILTCNNFNNFAQDRVINKTTIESYLLHKYLIYMGLKLKTSCFTIWIANHWT